MLTLVSLINKNVHFKATYLNADGVETNTPPKTNNMHVDHENVHHLNIKPTLVLILDHLPMKFLILVICTQEIQIRHAPMHYNPHSTTNATHLKLLNSNNQIHSQRLKWRS
jgi:hypothetical protein